MYLKKYQPKDNKFAECPKCLSKRLLYSKGKLTCTNCNHIIGATYNKYGAKKTEYNGHRYDSKLEANYAQHFDTMLKAKELIKVERQVKIPLEAYGKHITNYFIDFILTHKDNHKEYAEIKGRETDTWKLKLKMLEGKLEKEEPNSEIIVYYQGKTKRIR